MRRRPVLRCWIAIGVVGLALGANSAAWALDACKCENLVALQAELRQALLLRDRMQAKADELVSRFGSDPKGSELQQARETLERFVSGSGPGSASEGLPPVQSGSSDRVNYVPRGHRLRTQAAFGTGPGIPAGVKWENDIQVPDTVERKRVEKQWSDRKQNLCDPENAERMNADIQSGAACAGIAKARAAHENAHRKSCNDMGFYAFYERKPHQLALDEVNAYTVQANALGAEIQRVMGLKRTKVTKKPAGACPGCYLAVEATCLRSYDVSGAKGGIVMQGRICAIDKPFELRSVGQSKVLFSMKPAQDGTSGQYGYSGFTMGAQFNGSGRYTIAVGGDSARITFYSDGDAETSSGTVRDQGMGTFPMTPLPENCDD